MTDPLSIARDGIELGTLPLGEVRLLLDAKFLLPTDVFWRKGMTDWRPLAELDAASATEKPNSPGWSSSPRVRAAARAAGVLARKLKDAVNAKSETLARTRERVLEDFTPQLRELVAARLKQTTGAVDSTLKNDETMRKVFGAVFDCLPKPVTRFVTEEQFVTFCMKHRQQILGRADSQSTPAPGEPSRL